MMLGHGLDDALKLLIKIQVADLRKEAFTNCHKFVCAKIVIKREFSQFYSILLFLSLVVKTKTIQFKYNLKLFAQRKFKINISIYIYFHI